MSASTITRARAAMLADAAVARAVDSLADAYAVDMPERITPQLLCCCGPVSPALAVDAQSTARARGDLLQIEEKQGDAVLIAPLRSLAIWAADTDSGDDYDLRPCDVLLHPLALLRVDMGERVDYARRGAALAQRLKLSQYLWTFDAAAELGRLAADVSTVWPDWQLSWLALSILRRDPLCSGDWQRIGQRLSAIVFQQIEGVQDTAATDAIWAMRDAAYDLADDAQFPAQDAAPVLRHPRDLKR